MRFWKRTGIVVLVFVMAVSGLFAADAKSEATEAAGSLFGFGANIGPTWIDGEPFFTLKLTPDLNFGKFGVGMILNLDISMETGSLRAGEWDTWQAIMNKITYLRFGEKGDNFFIKMGVLEDAYIGHGTVVSGYENNLNFPETRVSGMQLDMDFGVFGIETLTDNFLDFDIFAGRLFIRPLNSSKIPVIEDLEFGLTYAQDYDNHNPAKSGADKYSYEDSTNSQSGVMVWAVDVGLPLPGLGFMDWTLFADFVKINGKGHGFSSGLFGYLLFLDWKFEYIRAGEHFTKPYFDSYYMVERQNKYDSLDDITEGYNGWEFQIGKNFSLKEKDDLTFKLRYYDNDKINPMIEARLHVDRSILGFMGFDFLYTKRDVYSAKKFFTLKDEDTIMKMYFNGKFASVLGGDLVGSLVYTKTFKWDTSDPANPVLEDQDSFSFEAGLEW